MRRAAPLLLVLFISLTVACRTVKEPPAEGVVKVLPSEDFTALALRLYGDPHRAGELAALCGRFVEEDPPEELTPPDGFSTAQPPLFADLEEPLDYGADSAPGLGARRLLARGDHAAAVTLLEDALAADPLRPDLRYLLGLTRARRGELRRALVELRAACYLAPTDPRPHLARALTAAVLDRPDEARRHADAARFLAQTVDWRADYLAALLDLAADEPTTAEARLFAALDSGPSYGPERQRMLELIALLQRGYEPLDPAWLSGAAPGLDHRGSSFEEPGPAD